MRRNEASRIRALKDTTARWLLGLGLAIAAAGMAQDARAACADDVTELQEAVKSGDRSAFEDTKGQDESSGATASTGQATASTGQPAPASPAAAAGNPAAGNPADDAEQSEAESTAVQKQAETLSTADGKQVELSEGDRPAGPGDSWQGATISDVSVIQFLDSAKEMAVAGDEDACQEQLLQAKMALGIVPSDTAAESHGEPAAAAAPK